MRTGSVTAVSGSATTVSVAGGLITSAGRNSAYTPVIGDRVLMLADDDNRWVIAFKIVGPAP